MAGNSKNKTLATALQVSPSAASRLRSGNRVGSPAVWLRLAEATDVSIRDILEAVVKAHNGDPTDWVEIVQKAETSLAA